MATLAVRDLTAGYRELDIVHGVSLHVEPGEIVTIIGPNGAGKSTLLRSIFGLVPPRRGAVTFMGEDVTGERPDRLVRKGMCFVPQNCNVFPRLTVEENLEMGAFVPLPRRGCAWPRCTNFSHRSRRSAGRPRASFPGASSRWSRSAAP